MKRKELDRERNKDSYVEKEKIYLRCLSSDLKATTIKGCVHIGVEHLGMCYGEAVTEGGKVVAQHTSTTLGWLRQDLLFGVDKELYDVIDLIEEDAKKLIEEGRAK